MTSERRVLVVEDDPRIALLLLDYLRSEGFDAQALADGQLALAEVRHAPPSLLILDLNLPGLDGVSLCRAVREFSDVPILMVTARIDELDRLLGLNSGADDYVCKPFSPRELVSRVKAVLRRTEPSSVSGKEPIAVDERLQIDLDRREIFVEGKPVKLRPTEFRLLYHLVSNAGWVVPHDQLLAKVWGYEYQTETHYLRLYINYLRDKLEQDPHNPKYILTERGVGYRFIDYKKKA